MLDGLLIDRILPTIYLIGAIQGLILATALLVRRPRSLANRLLAAFVGLFSVDMLFLFLMTVLDYREHTGLLVISDPLPFLYGPLIYLYTRTITSEQARLTRRDALHFVPFLAHAVSLLPVVFAPPAEKIAYWEQVIGIECPWDVRFWGSFVIVLSLGYMLAVQWVLRRHKRAIRDRFSELDRLNLDWLRFLAGTFLALWLLSFAIYALVQAGVAVGEYFGVIYVGVTVLIYAIGWMGLRQPAIFGVEVEESAPAPKYEKTRVPDAEAEALRERLLALMDTASPWRRNGLTLHELAADLEEPPHKLSQVLNDRLGVNFHDFVNGYRVREVQRRLEDPSEDGCTMLALALDAGFSSKSTFNTIFKKLAGVTPSAWRKARRTP